jgi:hypothetical protein
MLKTTEALLGGAVERRQVYVRYSGGVHVAVNGNARERMRATVAGTEIDLPSYGYRCWTDDGEVLVVSDDRRYYAKCRDGEYSEPKR